MTTRQWREHVIGKPGLTYRIASIISSEKFLLAALGGCIGFVLMAAWLQGIG
jgi:hypothetical protein